MHTIKIIRPTKVVHLKRMNMQNVVHTGAHMQITVSGHVLRYE